MQLVTLAKSHMAAANLTLEVSNTWPAGVFPTNMYSSSLLAYHTQCWPRINHALDPRVMFAESLDGLVVDTHIRELYPLCSFPENMRCSSDVAAVSLVLPHRLRCCSNNFLIWLYILC